MLHKPTFSLPPLSSSLSFSLASTVLFKSRCKRRPKSLNMVEPPERTIFCFEQQNLLTTSENERLHFIQFLNFKYLNTVFKAAVSRYVFTVRFKLSNTNMTQYEFTKSLSLKLAML